MYVFEILHPGHIVPDDLHVRSGEALSVSSERGHAIRTYEELLFDEERRTYYFLFEPSNATQRYFLSF